VITPHVASTAELTDERAWALLRENLRRFDAGEPLLNVVDKRAGY
jgi:phosphoglycerate dehydrogenase-like enzyme